ncbi:protein transport protein sec31-like isoform X9 [Canis lupus familiaris]|uniref:protein transport protein sec31-like isoform X1 n=1 Tax=Canis lupus familiaris TaxID=9615 RepID=UPI0018F4B7CF|nr:protein transport protein sec31-like isoform X1 [Canis lupus familiaris]XP_038313973.1 protein transport protein sec31-like isoform X9 [Canis lupus familiaris]XP_038428854.1 protein transport protein sec31-like isoform X7 [Canis lupus familiaris]
MTLGVRGHLHHSQQPEPAPTALGLATRPRGSHRVPSTHHPGPRTKPSDSSNSADQALTWLDATEGAASRAQEPGAPHADGLEPEPGAPTRPRPAAPSAARAPGSAQRVDSALKQSTKESSKYLGAAPPVSLRTPRPPVAADTFTSSAMGATLIQELHLAVAVFKAITYLCSQGPPVVRTGSCA